MMNYDDFFERLTSHRPYPYQRRLGEEEWPEQLSVPTGLGKTAAVVIAWLYGRYQSASSTPLRLVYCLPMRVLVKQTCSEIEAWLTKSEGLFKERNIPLPTAHVLMGGSLDEDWESHPERPAILVGTQDQLMSRALNRGYSMSRYKWPIHGGLLNNDVVWVFDELQLMGVAVETSAQLQAFRSQMGTYGNARSLWMSATLDSQRLQTIDFAKAIPAPKTLKLSKEETQLPAIQSRLHARKKCVRSSIALNKDSKKKYAGQLAKAVLQSHAAGTLTLVIVNRVERAQEIFEALRKQGRTTDNTGLVHSRFRPADRRVGEQLLHGAGDRIVVSTQVVEAGVDVSAKALWTELAPYSSVIQRAGRCNRYGQEEEAALYWVDIDETDKNSTLPYEAVELVKAREALQSLDDASPFHLEKCEVPPSEETRPVIRRRDWLELFDTTADLTGADIDISRFIRDKEDTDVQFFWRDLSAEGASAPDGPPERDELCSVSIAQASKFLKELKKKDMDALFWEPFESRWERVKVPRPGQRLCLPLEAGGYDPTLGWSPKLSVKIEPAIRAMKSDNPMEGVGDDFLTKSRWCSLTEHLQDVVNKVTELCHANPLRELLPDDVQESLGEAAIWHDVGKAHPAFQETLLGGAEDGVDRTGEIWAKSSHFSRMSARRGFRHELASALCFLQQTTLRGLPKSLVAYLIAAHHGKIRASIRALPTEERPSGGERLYARGVWQGDTLPLVRLPDGRQVGDCSLDLTPMQLGEGSWTEGVLSLRDHPDYGPFRLCFLETLLRISDWRASASLKKDATSKEKP